LSRPTSAITEVGRQEQVAMTGALHQLPFEKPTRDTIGKLDSKFSHPRLKRRMTSRRATSWPP
jgi:hypothetical protein